MANGVTTIIVTRANGTKYNVASASDVGEVSLETGWIGGHEAKRLLRRLTLEAEDGEFSIQVYGKNNLKDAETLIGTYPATGDEVVKLYSGSYHFFRFKITSTVANSRWSITAFEAYGALTSARVA